MSSPPTLLRFLLYRILIPLSIVSTAWLYFYPAFHLCAFPSPLAGDNPAPWSFLQTLAQHLHLPYKNDDIAPFRLLVFGDPQLEGDTSLPADGLLNFPSLGGLVSRVREADGLMAKGEAMRRQLLAFAREDIPRAVAGVRKKADLWGNDYYLAHIYRTMHWWSRPTHVVVLGDLLGSQWISDEEFRVRGDRFWDRVFRGGRKVGDEITMEAEGKVEVLGEDKRWGRRVACVVGNHDVGYAGDMNEERVERFERVFGRVNWDVRFQLPGVVESTTTPPPSIHLINLNSLNLDTPALSNLLQNQTYTFFNYLASSSPAPSPSDFTILLTHLPLYKPRDVCADAPFFAFHEETYGGGVREQNHLSEGSSRMILEGVFGMTPGGGGRNGIILTGHDHEGCDVYHHPSLSLDPSSHPYNTTPNTNTSPPASSLREITVRSMMGSYSGNTGLLSVWFSHPKGKWDFSYQDCRAGVQHWWWGIHVLNLVTVAGWVVARGRKEGRGKRRKRRVAGRRSERRKKRKV